MERKTIGDLDDIVNRMNRAIDLVGMIQEAVDGSVYCTKHYANALCAANDYLQLLGSELRSCVDDLFVSEQEK